MKLLRDGRRPLVVGHRGAAAVAAENTLPSLQAAVDAGADVVEFDVSPSLRLAHSHDDVRAESLSLDQALEFVAAHEVAAQVDVKLPGYERAVVEAIRRHPLHDRVFVATTWRSSARRVRLLAPELPVAFGYPRDRLGIASFGWPGSLARCGAVALRVVMPARIPLLLWESRATALALHHTLCSASSVAAAHRAGAAVLVWTVNDRDAVARVATAGVDAIVSDDPEMVRGALATLLAP